VLQLPGRTWRLQLTVRNIDEALDALRRAGPSTVVSTGGRIISQPHTASSSCLISTNYFWF
jgi:hypothetical protein